jgi:hypothetical protein
MKKQNSFSERQPTLGQVFDEKALIKLFRAGQFGSWPGTLEETCNCSAPSNTCHMRSFLH